VFRHVNPAGLTVTSFGVPAGVELEHDYLWRIHQALPQRGRIGVFNRSHYEDVVAVRMRTRAGDGLAPRYEHIRAFERMLVDEGTTVLKVFLNVSREEQRAPASRSGSTTPRSAGSSGATTSRCTRVRRLDRSLGRRADRDLDRLGAVARRPGRPELGQGPRRRRAPRATRSSARSRASRARAGLEGLRIA
jgi:hypothetical protein